MGVGKLQGSAYHSTHRIGDVSAQRNLHAAVERAAGRKEHGVASHQRIDSGKGRAGIRSQAKQGCRGAAQELTAGIQAVAGEIGDAGARHRGQVAADRRLRTGARRFRRARKLRCSAGSPASVLLIAFRAAMGIPVHGPCRSGVSHVISVIPDQIMSADVAHIVHAEYRGLP